MAKKEKSNISIYIEYIPFYLLYKLLCLLPLHTAYSLCIGLFGIFYRVAGKMRRRTIQHLLHAGVAADEAEAETLARKTFIEFGKLLVEIVKMNQEYSADKVTGCGSAKALDMIRDNGKGSKNNVIVVTAHYGNWEVAGTAFCEFTKRNMVSIMRPFGNPMIGKLILNHRRGSMHRLVNKDQAGVRQLLKALHGGEHISILIDQHAATSEGVDTVFFGQPCRTHKTPAMLHLKTGVPIVPELTRRVAGEDFRFEIVVGDPIIYAPTGDKDKDIREIMQLCTTALEKMIAEQPEQWLWVHRRWTNINREHKKR